MKKANWLQVKEQLAKVSSSGKKACAYGGKHRRYVGKTNSCIYGGK